MAGALTLLLIRHDVIHESVRSEPVEGSSRRESIGSGTSLPHPIVFEGERSRSQSGASSQSARTSPDYALLHPGYPNARHYPVALWIYRFG